MINWFVVSSDTIKKIGHDVTNDYLYIDFFHRNEYEVYESVSLYAFYHFVLTALADDYYQQIIKPTYYAQLQ